MNYTPWRKVVDSHHILRKKDALVSTEARRARPVDNPELKLVLPVRIALTLGGF